MIRRLSARLYAMFGRELLERELDTELRYHLDMLVEQNVKAGMPPDQARREARRVFGDIARVKDDVRDKWSRFARRRRTIACFSRAELALPSHRRGAWVSAPPHSSLFCC